MTDGLNRHARGMVRDRRAVRASDANDNRPTRTVDGVSKTYVRDGAASYTPGISERRGTVSTYLHGGLKNSVTQGAQNGTLSATRHYDAFGNVVSSTGTWRGPFGYAGAFGYQEDQTGLRLLGHRYYDSSTGRFLTRDPVKDGRNWYGYGAGEITPVRESDPTGLAIPLAWGLGVIAVAGIVRLGHELDKIFDEAREDKIDPDSDTWGSDEELENRWREDVPGWLERTRKEAVDAYHDQYVTGVIGDIGGDGVKLGIEAYKAVKEVRSW